MLFKLHHSLALVTLTLMILLSVTGVQAVSSVLLGYCTDNNDHCENKWGIYADPSWDQTIQATSLNLFNNKTETVTCTSFSSATEYRIKVCACELCHGCEGSECNEAVRGQCTGSQQTGTYLSICSVDVK